MINVLVTLLMSLKSTYKDLIRWSDDGLSGDHRPIFSTRERQLKALVSSTEVFSSSEEALVGARGSAVLVTEDFVAARTIIWPRPSTSHIRSTSISWLLDARAFDFFTKCSRQLKQCLKDNHALDSAALSSRKNSIRHGSTVGGQRSNQS